MFFALFIDPSFPKNLPHLATEYQRAGYVVRRSSRRNSFVLGCQSRSRYSTYSPRNEFTLPESTALARTPPPDRRLEDQFEPSRSIV